MKSNLVHQYKISHVKLMNQTASNLNMKSTLTKTKQLTNRSVKNQTLPSPTPNPLQKSGYVSDAFNTP